MYAEVSAVIQLLTALVQAVYAVPTSPVTRVGGAGCAQEEAVEPSWPI
jgi:hypothetical protein